MPLIDRLLYPANDAAECKSPLTLHPHCYHPLPQPSQTQAGSEALTAARLVYKFAKSSNVGAGLEPLIEDMGKRYRAQGQRQAKTAPQ